MAKHENKIWSLLFLLVPILGVWLFWYAYQPHLDGRTWWFPRDVGTFGPEVDGLYNFILWITGIAFVITEIILVAAIWKYGRQDEQGEARAAVYTHGNPKLEMVWTAVPAVILLVIALVQMDTWKRIKFPGSFPKANIHAKVTAGQFEWRMAYPGKDGKLGTDDDVHDVNHLHVVANTKVIIQLTSRDVIHSFFLPNVRIKQDAVPGLVIPVWFEPREAGGWELMCAELCGWGHYKMKGWLTVHKDQAEFDAWLESARKTQEADNDKDRPWREGVTVTKPVGELDFGKKPGS